MNNIKFKEIKNFPGYYVYENGNIISTKQGYNRILKPYTSNKGYQYIKLFNKDYELKHCAMHRLVALAFVDNRHSKREVNHKDFNKKNNHYTNLEWNTSKENKNHMYTQSDHTPVRNYSRSLLYKDGVLVADFISVSEACRFAAITYGVSFESMRRYKKVRDLKIVIE